MRLLSIACSLVLLVSFAMFVSDQANTGEKHTVADISSKDSPTTSQPLPAQQPTKKKHGAVRNTIEDVNSKLVSPFKGVVASDSKWTQHIVETLLAFLVFGLGLGFLSRYAASRGI